MRDSKVKSFSQVGTVIVCLSLGVRPVWAAQVPPGAIDSVAAIGIMLPSEVKPGDQPPKPGEQPPLVWHTEGTGFFYGYLVKDDPDPLKRRYEVYLVTARHVVDGHIKRFHSEVLVRVDAKDTSQDAAEFNVPSSDGPNYVTWFYHPRNNVDVAATYVDMGLLKQKGFEPQFFSNDLHSANLRKLRELEITAGEGVFILGFPMDLAGAKKNYVIVRHGAIARISETLEGVATNFLLDALVYPGNSGGPVLLKPELMSISGTKASTNAYLIGIVLNYRTYTDTAVSMQTERPRVTFEENSGLAEVLPVDYIDEAIAAWRPSHTKYLPRP